MKTRSILRLWRRVAGMGLLLFLMLTPLQSVYAQQPLGEAGGEGALHEEPPPHRDGEIRERVHERIRAARDQHLTKRLALEEEEAKALFELLDAFEREEIKARRARQDIRRRLRSALDTSTDDATLRALSEEMIQAEDALHTLRRARFEETAKALSAKQQAQLLVALPEFERKVRRLIRKARRKEKGGRGGRGKGRKNRRPKHRPFNGPR